ncbi:MAG TPA: transporter [Thermoanaerobaculia bacterium]|nr:transporter [Thermoanaerobaculia bacterium]
MKTSEHIPSRLLLRSLLTILVTLSPIVLFGGQPLETESARMLPSGAMEVETVVEVQTSSDGRERAVALLFEAGLPHNWQFTIEPVPYTSIKPRHARGATGPGDLEITLTHQFLSETVSRPAFAVAGEVKLPTATNDLIGTGKTDVAILGLATKRFGRIDAHLNLGYNFIGSPKGANLGNIFNYAVAAELHLRPGFDVVGEIIGNTSSTPDAAEGDAGGGTITPEAAGGETSALVGIKYDIRPALVAGLGLSYDNNSAFLVRAGLTFRFGRGWQQHWPR